MTFDQIVDCYIQKHRERVRKEMQFFQPKFQHSLSNAIHNAALCLDSKGAKLPHQYRIPMILLKKAERRLQLKAAVLRQVDDFDALHNLVKDVTSRMSGIGELAVYDIAQRIGVYLGKAPELVYLHRGTRKGAAVLGLRGKTIRPNELPPAFSQLSAAEIEDCLCIYKDKLRDSKTSTGQTTSCGQHHRRRSMGGSPRQLC
jgi:hypothetical protein